MYPMRCFVPGFSFEDGWKTDGRGDSIETKGELRFDFNSFRIVVALAMIVFEDPRGRYSIDRSTSVFVIGENEFSSAIFATDNCIGKRGHVCTSKDSILFPFLSPIQYFLTGITKFTVE